MKALSVATLFSAIAGFVIIWVAFRTLGPAGYTFFAAYWGFFFTLAGVLDGITHETTRAVASVREGRSAQASPWKVPLVISGLTLVAIGASGTWWMPSLVPDHVAVGTVLLALGSASYALQATVAGILAGRARWTPYALLMAIDSGIRLVLAFFAQSVEAFLYVTVIGAGTWLVVLAWVPVRSKVDVDQLSLSKGIGWAMVSSGASAILISGFPALLAFTSQGENSALMGTLILAVTLTRAPILVPVQRFQSALISHFVSGKGSMLAPVGAVFAVGAIGAVLAWLVGPWIMDVFFNADISGITLAVLTFASGCIGALMITGAATLALNLHRSYVFGWLTAVFVATLILLIPLDMTPRVILALLIGPIAGIFLHLYSLRPSKKEWESGDDEASISKL